MSVIHAPPVKRLDFRLVAIGLFVGVAFVVLIGRLWYLQVAQGEEIRERAQRSSIAWAPRLAPRGLIVDREGTPIADVAPTLTLLVRPDVALQSEDGLRNAAELLFEDPQELIEDTEELRYRSPLYVPLRSNVPFTVASQIAESPELFPGLTAETQPTRVYPAGEDFAHVLGWVGTPTPEQVQALSQSLSDIPPFVGREGLEMAFERDLMGSPGYERVQVDSRRRHVRTMGTDAPVPGNRVQVGLHAPMQRLAKDLLEGQRGAVVAIEPSTGDVLALLSSPTYDAARYREDYNRLLNDDDKPLLNRAMRGQYPPGSTFKLVTTLAWMATRGDLDPERRIYCPGYYRVGNEENPIRCNNRSGHGSLNLREAIAESCNTYFLRMAHELGLDGMTAGAETVGILDPVPFDLPGLSAGVWPTESFRESRGAWQVGETVQLGIGQSVVSTTPFQMAFAVAAVANRGGVMRPRLVRAIADEPVPTESLERLAGSPEAWTAIVDGMVLAIEDGTARRAQISGLRWAGKTGSAQNPHGDAHAWFVGFAPADNPTIAIAVLVENGGSGGAVAAPIARDLVDLYLNGPAEATVTALPSDDEA